MARKLSILALILLVGSCAQDVKKHDMNRRNLAEYLMRSEVVKYFLPDIPAWANFSQTGDCHRTGTVRLMNFQDLRNSFSLSYAEAVHFQHMFNVEIRNLKKRAKLNYLPIKEEEKLFYKISDKIQAGIRQFVLPKFKRVNIVWIDSVLNSKESMKSLKKLLKSEEMGKGHPLFLSLCLNHSELVSFMETNNFGNSSIRLLSYELFTTFDDSNKMRTFFSLNFHKIFRKDQKLHFFTKDKEIPIAFDGDFKVHKF